MQKKILLPLILVLWIGWVAFAAFLNPKMLPDTAEFPRIPMGSGTIWEIIGKILGTTDLGNYILNGGDGTVKNTQTLSWVTASGYLKNTTCVSNTQVWTGFDTNGTAVCGTKSGLLTFGTISSQDCAATIYPADNSSSHPTSTGMTLKAGDIIKTNPSCGMTIAFVDTSILRLDRDTTASLDISTNSIEPGKQIASLILESGQVWGRILSPDTPTSTGYTIGSDEVVAWVRGTSIAVYKGAGSSTPSWDSAHKTWTLTKNPTISTDIVVVHSRFAANMLTWVVQITTRDGTKKIMNPGDKISYTNTNPTSLTPTAHTLVDLYTTTPWIRDNTKKDLDYLTSPITINSSIGTLTINNILNHIIPSELAATESSDITVNSAFCGGGNIFWNSLLGTSYEKCRPSNLLAFADFSSSTTSWNNTSTQLNFSSGSSTKLDNKPGTTWIFKDITLPIGTYQLCATYTGWWAAQVIAWFSGATWTWSIRILSGWSSPLCSNPFSITTALQRWDLHIGGDSTFSPGTLFNGKITKIEIKNVSD